MFYVVNHDYRFVWVVVHKVASRTFIWALRPPDPNWKYSSATADKEREPFSGFDDYFKFAFVRNPWDRLVSTFFDKTKKVVGTKYEIPYYARYRDASFSEFVRSLTNVDLSSADRHIKEQVQSIPKNVDFVGRFENLQKDINYVCDKVGLPHQKLPYENKTDHKPYWKYYDDETRQIVAKKYKNDIETFGYEFGK
jgi:hypothetical protein